MKNRPTTTFSWVRTTTILCLTSIGFLAIGCKKKPWEGKFVAPPDNKCYVLEYIEVYPDRTADVKYESLKGPVNFEADFDTLNQVLVIRELNKQWGFKLSNDTLYEVSNIDSFCILVKEKKK